MTASVAVLLGVAELPAAATPRVDLPMTAALTSTVEPVTSRPDMVSAGLAARAQGSRVEVSGAQTETGTTYVNPDGAVTVEQAQKPVRVRRGDRLVPVDLGLVSDSTGVHPAVSATPVTFSAGGTGVLGSVAQGAGSLELSWPGSLPAPALVGATAAYRLDATTRLLLTATDAGFTAHVELSARPATAAVWRLPMRLTGGLSLRRAEDGALTVLDSSGRVVFAKGRVRTSV